MNYLNSLFSTLLGYLKHPELYPELGRKLYKNIFQRSSATKNQLQSLEWCEKQAISEESAINHFTQDVYDSIYETYSNEIEWAKNKEQNCPVKMGGAGALNLIYSLCECTQAKNVLETGVAYGWSSLAALLSLQKREGTLYSSDMPYLDRNNDAFVGCVVPDNLKKYWKLFRFADRESLPKIFKEQTEFELIHYDSDKSYNGRIWAYQVLWSKLTKNGFFISDDIMDNSAFMDWCTETKLQPIVVAFEGKYVGIVKKI